MFVSRLKTHPITNEIILKINFNINTFKNIKKKCENKFKTEFCSFDLKQPTQK